MLDKLIKYFVYETKGHITKTQLVKFLYLADLYSVKWTGNQLTELDWCYYRHGPWNEDIDVALAKMNGKEIFQEQQGETILIRLGSEAGSVEELSLPQSLKLMLENIRKEWAGSGSEKIAQLLEYVYNTVPMVEARKNYRSEDKMNLDLTKERENLIDDLNF